MPIKIPLFKAKSLGFERDMVTFFVQYGAFRVITSAIVDTGCPFTILNENSVKRSRIPYHDQSDSGPVLIGNIQLQLKELGVCKLYFRDEKNQLTTFEQMVYVGIPMVKGYLAQELPSFLGKDFLNSHSLSIINKKGEICLLKEDE
ncbi:hypothetical protein HY491_02190 [Candidatus Woesearchaeota archaeon]|nr:hypothetical protein [Candidatus Woesearchaeota archaeon]